MPPLSCIKQTPNATSEALLCHLCSINLASEMHTNSHVRQHSSITLGFTLVLMVGPCEWDADRRVQLYWRPTNLKSSISNYILIAVSHVPYSLCAVCKISAIFSVLDQNMIPRLVHSDLPKYKLNFSNVMLVFLLSSD